MPPAATAKTIECRTLCQMQSRQGGGRKEQLVRQGKSKSNQGNSKTENEEALAYLAIHRPRGLCSFHQEIPFLEHQVLHIRSTHF